MINIVQGGNEAFNAMMFGPPDPTLQSYLSNQFANTTHQLTDYGRALYDQGRAMFERFSGENAMRYLRALGRAAGAVWQTDSIRTLTAIGELQWAPPTMQRWIMAEPSIRKLYHEQRLDGYSHHYRDMDPSGIGPSHYDYRRAMQGLAVFDETDDPNVPEWSATTYFDDLVEGDTELDLADQVIIQHTWEWLRHHRKYGKEDPTDRFNASIE